MNSTVFRPIFFCLLLVLISGCKNENQITPIDVWLSTQTEVNAFNYSSIPGNLIISGELIEDLAPLSKLTHVGGYLSIDNTALLTNLKGLENLSTIDSGLTISHNFSLTSLESLSTLRHIGKSIMISDNRQLTSLEGLRKVEEFNGSFVIDTNEKLTDLRGFDYSSINYLSISRCDLITDFKGLELIRSLEYLGITENSNLKSFNGLQNLVRIAANFTVYGNNSLPNFIGLLKLNFVGRLDIQKNGGLKSLEGLNCLSTVEGSIVIGASYKVDTISNPLLTDFCAISLLVIGKNESYVYINSNGYNPTHQQFLDGECALNIHLQK